jgi:hypothetical protein
MRKEEMEKDKAKREARKAAKKANGPLLEDAHSLADAGEPVEATVDDEDEAGVDEEEESTDDDLPDLLLRESARIVGDMIVLGNDEPTLARQFSTLTKVEESDSIN